MTTMNKWTPTTDLLTLRRMGKLLEELGEASNVAARVIIQGIDEVDPGSGKVNRQRLLDELADVAAQIECTLSAFGLDRDYFGQRTAHKVGQMAEWEALFASDGVKPCRLTGDPIPKPQCDDSERCRQAGFCRRHPHPTCGVPVAHTDHPLRHYDRTCAACNPDGVKGGGNG